MIKGGENQEGKIKEITKVYSTLLKNNKSK